MPVDKPVQQGACNCPNVSGTIGNNTHNKCEAYNGFRFSIIREYKAGKNNKTCYDNLYIYKLQNISLKEAGGFFSVIILFNWLTCCNLLGKPQNIGKSYIL